MKIIKTKTYERDYKNKLVKKHKKEEIENIEDLELLILMSKNFDLVLKDDLSHYMKVEKKKGNLKEVYTARIGKKGRLIMVPIGEYPYVAVEIKEIIFEEIDDSHYGGK